MLKYSVNGHCYDDSKLIMVLSSHGQDSHRALHAADAQLT